MKYRDVPEYKEEEPQQKVIARPSSNRRFIDDMVEYRIVPASKWQQLKTTIQGESGLPEDETWEENEHIRHIRKCNGIFVNDAFIDLWDYDGRLLFLDGAYGSSKTTYAITRLLIKCMTEPYFSCFYGRQVYTKAAQLHKNIVYEIKRNNWEMYFDFSIKPTGSKEIFYKGTGEKCIGYGNIFTMFGCDDNESIKGWSNPTHIMLDEINQIDFDTFGMLYTRLRTPGVKTQFIGLFNNCDVRDGHWIKDVIYGTAEGSTEKEKVLVAALRKSRTRMHHSIYTDNKFQNPAAYYIQLVIKAGGDERLIDAYCNGSWGVELNAQPYYKFFLQSEHVRNVEYNPRLSLAFIFDENVNPYFPSLIAQKDGNDLIFIDEICAKNPNNTLEWVCSEFVKRYDDHSGPVEIYGDATSKKQDVKMKKGQNLFTMAKSYLQKFDPAIRVPESNPHNGTRGRFINLILKSQYGGLRIIVSPKCVNLIRDLKHCMEDANPANVGMKDKKRVMVDGTRAVQPLGHMGDCFIGCTFVETNIGSIRIDNIQVGDLVLTRKGYRRVLKTWNRGVKEVRTYKINGIDITCTDNHKFYASGEWKEIGNIVYDRFSFYSKGKISESWHESWIKDNSCVLYETFDIMVEDEHEFFANGILVHNCLDYYICETEKPTYNRFKAGGNSFPVKGGGRETKNTYADAREEFSPLTAKEKLQDSAKDKSYDFNNWSRQSKNGY